VSNILSHVLLSCHVYIELGFVPQSSTRNETLRIFHPLSEYFGSHGWKSRAAHGIPHAVIEGQSKDMWKLAKAPYHWNLVFFSDYDVGLTYSQEEWTRTRGNMYEYTLTFTLFLCILFERVCWESLHKLSVVKRTMHILQHYNDKSLPWQLAQVSIVFQLISKKKYALPHNVSGCHSGRYMRLHRRHIQTMLNPQSSSHPRNLQQ